MTTRSQQINIGRDRVIVIGGSIAGLLIAAVLVKYFSQVTVIERDKRIKDHYWWESTVVNK
ncbi:MAG: NAD-binding protein [Xenococcaceae cyanobacterium MO_207.B15]|nr:NAD-binding protein [Xenococcaceae cyanobacterium MO_207.B15]